MAKGLQKQRKVDIQDPESPWTKGVLDAAETLAGHPLEIKGAEGQRYFVAPSPTLARLCRRWLLSPLPGSLDPDPPDLNGAELSAGPKARAGLHNH
jgi:hypothetical protein